MIGKYCWQKNPEYFPAHAVNEVQRHKLSLEGLEFRNILQNVQQQHKKFRKYNRYILQKKSL